MASSLPPHDVRCFLSGVSQQTNRIRVIGVVVSIVQEYSDEPPFLILDDGTALVALLTQSHMLSSVSCTVGSTVDCICDYQRDVWVIDTLMIVEDPNACTLRWFEITYLQQQHENGETSRAVLSRGYPTKRLDSQTLYEFIETEAGKDGLSLEDLALLLDISQSRVQTMLQDLQLNGQVYQGTTGKFLPL